MEISLASYYLCVGVPQASPRYLLEMHTLRPHSRLREPECAVQQDVPRWLVCILNLGRTDIAEIQNYLLWVSTLNLVGQVCSVWRTLRWAWPLDSWKGGSEATERIQEEVGICPKVLIEGWHLGAWWIHQWREKRREEDRVGGPWRALGWCERRGAEVWKWEKRLIRSASKSPGGGQGQERDRQMYQTCRKVLSSVSGDGWMGEPGEVTRGLSARKELGAVSLYRSPRNDWDLTKRKFVSWGNSKRVAFLKWETWECLSRRRRNMQEKDWIDWWSKEDLIDKTRSWSG